jgi:hypothetical protein
MEDEINEATSELGNLNMETVSQKEGYSRHSEKVGMVSDMQRTLMWRNGETRCIVPKIKIKQ